MHRIDEVGNVAGLFTEGNPATSTPATKVGDDWLNDMQENCCQAVEAAGITLVKGTYTQLTSAINALSRTSVAAANNSFSGTNAFAKGITVTQSTAGGAGATITAGAGGIGAVVTSGTDNFAIQAAANGSGGQSAIFISTSGTNCRGITLTASGAGTGLDVTPGATGTGAIIRGGATSGTGITVTGGGTSGTALDATGGGTNGHAIVCAGAGSGNALRVGTGHAKFTASNPGTTTAFTNTLTPKNICKAWAHVTVTRGASGSPVFTLNEGFNIASVASTSGHAGVTFTFADPMASANYAVSGGSADNNVGWPLAISPGLSTGSVVLAWFPPSGAAAYDFGTNTSYTQFIWIQVMAAQ